ncbi:hypothetical protein M595_2727 [Lyngbya aestuarii BL J]|uniref:Uncharacterized protein n=1 Tax=Lyngbya aestuarii BL J TaxID=1348334 RepID=U7QJ25_9CYAN|nr:hypothetical protein M595_2727 [Lyngbya aestuarii BL J]
MFGSISLKSRGGILFLQLYRDLNLIFFISTPNQELQTM